MVSGEEFKVIIRTELSGFSTELWSLWLSNFVLVGCLLSSHKLSQYLLYSSNVFLMAISEYVFNCILLVMEYVSQVGHHQY